MNKLDFVRKLYRGKNCYSDPLTPEEIELIHIRSTTENIISQMLEDKKIIFLTGNPGDGKTYIIKALDSVINKVKAYVEMDLSSIEDYSDIVENIKQCYENGSACIIAANEYPFIKLEKAMGEKYPEISEEIRDVKKNSIVYGVPSFECGRIVVVDLNDRNLLDREKKTILAVIDKLVGLLEDSKGINHKGYPYTVRYGYRRGRSVLEGCVCIKKEPHWQKERQWRENISNNSGGTDDF